MESHKVIDFVRGSIFKPLVALTFDGGGGQSFAPEIQAALGGVRCTMFVTGNYIQQRQQHLLQLLEAGHEFGNHTLNHLRLYDPQAGVLPAPINREVVVAELAQTAELYQKLTGQPMTSLWRAPFGARNQQVLEWAAGLGLRHVHWTHDTADWRTDPADPLSRPGREMLRQLGDMADFLPYGLNGAIVLMHLGAKHPHDPLFLRLGAFLREMQDKGCRFVTVTELLSNADASAIFTEAAQVGRNPLPVGAALEQVGWHEGIYADGWAGADSSFRVRTRRPISSLKILADVPGFFRRAVRLHIFCKPGVDFHVELAPIGEQLFSIPVEVRGSEYVQLLIKSEQSFNCSVAGINDDRRELAFRLISIDAE
ncbi:MAG: polysaccharide deacetylase family protein [Oligoflexia bacterium]|nr:polysaccharide deacetylase family protein [Oligoflexia bacterium]